MRMRKYWAFVRTDVGAFMKVVVESDTAYNAKQMLLAMYGDNLISEAALIPE